MNNRILNPVFLALSFALAASGCGKSGGSNAPGPGTYLEAQTTSANNATSNSDPVLSVVNFKEGYRITIFLNDEPLVNGTGLVPIDWKGYPIRPGTNQIRVEALALGTDDSTPVYARIDLESPAEEIAVLRANCQGSNLFTTNFQFELPYRFTLASSEDYEPIPADARTVSNELAKLSLSIISVLGSRDAGQIAKLLKMEPAAAKSLFPPWYFDSTIPAEITQVKNPNDLDIVFGRRFAMVRPCLSYQMRHPHSGLREVANASTKHQFTTECLMFSRANHHWCLVRPDGGSVELSTPSE